MKVLLLFLESNVSHGVFMCGECKCNLTCDQEADCSEMHQADFAAVY